MALARPTLEEILAMSFDEQSKVMCDLAAKINNPISARYAFWSVNVKLCFWYELGEYMRQGKVAPIPPGYRLSANANSVLEAVKKVEQGQQITLLRNFVVDMGYDPDVNDSEVVNEPIVAPTPGGSTRGDFHSGRAESDHPELHAAAERQRFRSADQFFLDDGALQPPFQRPIVGREAILKFFKHLPEPEADASGRIRRADRRRFQPDQGHRQGADPLVRSRGGDERGLALPSGRERQDLLRCHRPARLSG